MLPPSYLRHIPNFTVNKWSYDTHGEAILEVVAQILATQRSKLVKEKRRVLAG